jgi:hypothetical protein
MPARQRALWAPRRLALVLRMLSRFADVQVLARSPAESAEAPPDGHAPAPLNGNGHTPALVERSDTVAVDEPGASPHAGGARGPVLPAARFRPPCRPSALTERSAELSDQAGPPPPAAEVTPPTDEPPAPSPAPKGDGHEPEPA